MFLKWASQSLWWGLFAVGTLACIPAMAQDPSVSPDPITQNEPIRQPTPAEQVDTAAGFYRFWPEQSLAEDAKSLFVIERGEARITKRSKQFESLYFDLMKQQNEDHAIVRTQDISNLFETSLLEMQQK